MNLSLLLSTPLFFLVPGTKCLTFLLPVISGNAPAIHPSALMSTRSFITPASTHYLGVSNSFWSNWSCLSCPRIILPSLVPSILFLTTSWLFPTSSLRPADRAPLQIKWRMKKPQLAVLAGTCSARLIGWSQYRWEIRIHSRSQNTGYKLQYW